MIIKVILASPNNPAAVPMLIDIATLYGPNTTLKDYVDYYAAHGFTVTVLEIDGAPVTTTEQVTPPFHSPLYPGGWGSPPATDGGTDTGTGGVDPAPVAEPVPVGGTGATNWVLYAGVALAAYLFLVKK